MTVGLGFLALFLTNYGQFAFVGVNFCVYLHTLCFLVTVSLIVSAIVWKDSPPISPVAKWQKLYSTSYSARVRAIVLQCFDTVGWRQEGQPVCKKNGRWWEVGTG